MTYDVSASTSSLSCNICCDCLSCFVIAGIKLDIEPTIPYNKQMNTPFSWHRNLAGTAPQENTRILVSDGEHVGIARFIIEETGDRIWFFEGVASFDVIWWMPLEPLPPIIA